MRLQQLAGVAAALVAMTVGARAAEEHAWDPAKDEGVPEDKLFEAADKGEDVPGAKASRRVVKAKEPAADTSGTADPGARVDQDAMEEVPIAKPKKRAARPSRTIEDEGDSADESAPPPKQKKGGGQQFASRRIQVFLIPVGEASSLAAGPAQLALEDEVGKLPGFKPVDLVEELAVPPPAKDRATLEEARRIIGDGNKQLIAHAYDEAANRYRRAIRTLEQANWAMEAYDYADAWARLGIALQLAGEDTAGREALQNAARVDQANQVDARLIDRKTAGNLEGAREDVGAGPAGALSIVTSPGGARVFLGGVYKGTSPVTIDRAPAGLNYVRVDRPGAYPVVQLVEVKEAFDTPVKIKMKFTEEALELQHMLQQVPKSLARGDQIPDMVKALGSRFTLERAVVATVEMAKTNVASIRMCVFDFPKQARIADETGTFAVDVEGGLEAAVAKWASGVFDKGDATRNRSSKDPLNRSDGTETWYSTDTTRSKTVGAQDADEDDENKPAWEKKNYKPNTYRKDAVKSKDPLDHGDGTEDW